MSILTGLGVRRRKLLATLAAGCAATCTLASLLPARAAQGRGEGPSDDSFARARERVRAALAAMGSGDPAPYTASWAKSDDVTLFGAWGPIERGFTRLSDTFRWVGGRFKGGALVPEDVIAFESGDLAYTVGFERGEVSVDGGPRRPMTIRVTHVYRRVEGAWRLVHRHADFPPTDQRQSR
jgi:ketosteroid isomerase-like protein